MKINKTLIILSLLLVFSISLGAVSATEDVDVNDIDNNYVATVESSVMNEEISTVSEGQINKSSEIYDEIKNVTGIYNITTDYQIDKTWEIGEGNVIIEGNNHTIYGNGHQAFYITGMGVTIQNLNFVDCSSGEGGAIYFWCSGSVVNCSFVNCSTTGRGGAIYFFSISSSKVSGCSFVNCRVLEKYFSNDGGVIYFAKSGSVVNCSFVNCSVNSNFGSGGAIYFVESGSVVNCSFVNCFTLYNSGAIYFFGSGSVVNCSFMNCSTLYNGGAIYFGDKGSVNYCIFENNTASNGSAIYFEDGGSGNVDFNFFAFQNNVTSFPNDLIMIYDMIEDKCVSITPNNWIVLDIVRFGSEYVVKFVDKNGNNLDNFMIDYNASLIINGGNAKEITIKNNAFSGPGVVGDYLLISLLSNNILVNTTLARVPVENYDVVTFDCDYGGIASVVVIVDDYITGNITVKVGDKEFTGIIKKGHASIPISGLSCGVHNLKISYSGGGFYLPFNITANVTVNKVHITVTPTALSTTYGSDKYFQIKVVDNNQKPINGLKLTLKVYTESSYETVYVTTDANGIAKYSASKLSIGTHKVVVSLSNANYVSPDKTSSITISKVKKSSMSGNGYSNGKKSVYYNNKVSNSVGNMGDCGNPLIALLIALISLPIIRRK